MRLIAYVVLAFGGIAVGLAGLRACHPLPPLEGRSVSTAFTDTADTRLGRAIDPFTAAHPGATGVYVLGDARDAFAVRMLLAGAAERSLDVQYYIWRGDLTGRLLLAALRAAAERGVRVRLLLDDNNTAGLDGLLAALDAHPNAEVRLFNPFTIRWARPLNFLTDFARLNRRMHNKSFTADNRATVIGGRNVGDEYFDAVADGAVRFNDLDVLAIGPVVDDVSADFDRYWASGSSYPAARVLRQRAAAGDELAAAAAAIERSPAALRYVSAVRSSATVERLIAGALELEWTAVRMVSDDPAKGLGKAQLGELLWSQLVNAVGAPERSLDLVTPYFVPTSSGVAQLTELAARGVRVRVLVNALEATDVVAVHSGYAKWRPALLEGGIELYESRLAPPQPPGGGRIGSSGSSLHAKTFAVDRARLFIGSFNFDPRSANLNTELGFVIESPTLAGQLAAFFDEDVPSRAYTVHAANGGLYWTEQTADAEVGHHVEPGTTWLQRAFVWILSLLPIDSLL